MKEEFKFIFKYMFKLTGKVFNTVLINRFWKAYNNIKLHHDDVEDLCESNKRRNQCVCVLTLTENEYGERCFYIGYFFFLFKLFSRNANTV